MSLLLLPGTQQALSAAAHVYRSHPTAAHRCAMLARRLDGPLRVALAGRVKAGKSTLLNALTGARLAPADVGECTRVVTWYRSAPMPWITLVPRTGSPRPLPVHCREGALEIDLGDSAGDVERLVVDWPAPGLREWTVIDTPGVASLSADVSARTTQLLDPAGGSDHGVDAVIYLMRHVHAADVDLLQTLRGARSSRFVNTVAVLSRADEIGSGRTDAMEVSAAVAHRYRRDPTVRGLCLDVVAVTGLLAETGRTLGAHEVAAVHTLAALPPAVLDEMLRSADRFLAAADVDLSPEQRARLLDRLGVFGVRTATRLVAEGTSGAAELGEELVRRSGLIELQASLATRFRDRSEVLVAHSVLLGLRRLLRDEPAPGTAALAADVGRMLRSAHELVELRALATLRAGEVALPPEAVGEGLALLGDAGPAVHARLGLPPDRPDRECRATAAHAVHRWRAWAENPLADDAAARLCRTVVRTCEGIVAGGAVTSGGARRTS
jgi:50S ribosome-binding GTPase